MSAYYLNISTRQTFLSKFLIKCLCNSPIQRQRPEIEQNVAHALAPRINSHQLFYNYKSAAKKVSNQDTVYVHRRKHGEKYIADKLFD